MRFFTKRLDTELMAESFRSGAPFPHIVLDDFLDADALRVLAAAFPKVEERQWWQYDNQLEMKFAFNDVSQLDSSFADFFREANSPEVITQLERLTGLKGIIPDPGLNGGGLHQIKRGGKLDVHEDYNIHKGLSAFRKVNLIAYLNESWEESYGGHLQLWDAAMSRCERSVLPVFNRVVIFRTDMKSNHGHPEPLTCPEDRARRSLAVYYYVPMTEAEQVEYTSTQFKKRPTDPDDPQVDELRTRRNKGRLADKKT